jgi:hypothetical protein
MQKLNFGGIDMVIDEEDFPSSFRVLDGADRQQTGFVEGQAELLYQTSESNCDQSYLDDEYTSQYNNNHPNLTDSPTQLNQKMFQTPHTAPAKKHSTSKKKRAQSPSKSAQKTGIRYEHLDLSPDISHKIDYTLENSHNKQQQLSAFKIKASTHLTIQKNPLPKNLFTESELTSAKIQKIRLMEKKISSDDFFPMDQRARLKFEHESFGNLKEAMGRCRKALDTVMVNDRVDLDETRLITTELVGTRNACNAFIQLFYQEEQMGMSESDRNFVFTRARDVVDAIGEDQGTLDLSNLAKIKKVVYNSLSGLRAMDSRLSAVTPIEDIFSENDYKDMEITTKYEIIEFLELISQKCDTCKVIDDRPSQVSLDLKTLNSLIYTYDETNAQVLRKLNLIISIIDFELFSKLDTNSGQFSDRYQDEQTDYIQKVTENETLFSFGNYVRGFLELQVKSMNNLMYQRLVDFTDGVWEGSIGLFTRGEFDKFIPTLDAICLGYADKNAFDVFKLLVDKIHKKRVDDAIVKARPIKVETVGRTERLGVRPGMGGEDHTPGAFGMRTSMDYSPSDRGLPTEENLFDFLEVKQRSPDQDLILKKEEDLQSRKRALGDWIKKFTEVCGKYMAAVERTRDEQEKLNDDEKDAREGSISKITVTSQKVLHDLQLSLKSNEHRFEDFIRDPDSLEILTKHPLAGREICKAINAAEKLFTKNDLVRILTKAQNLINDKDFISKVMQPSIFDDMPDKLPHLIEDVPYLALPQFDFAQSFEITQFEIKPIIVDLLYIASYPIQRINGKQSRNNKRIEELIDEFGIKDMKPATTSLASTIQVVDD